MHPPEYYNFAEDVVRRMAEERPRDTALLAVDEAGRETRWSFGLFQEQSSRLAHLLLASGLEPRAIVIVMVRDLAHRIVAQLAILRAGGVSFLVRHGTSSRELQQYVDRTSPALAITGPEGAGLFPPQQRVLVIPSQELESRLRSIPSRFESPRLRSEDPAQITLTGGTTGPPKMVVHTCGSKLYHYLRWTVSFDSDDLSWDFSGRWWMGAWRHGSPVFDRSMPVDRGPDTTRLILETLARYRITRLMATPRLYRDLLAQGATMRSCPTLRRCWSSGQALDLTVYRSWTDATGIVLQDRYSQTECGEAPVYPEETGWRPGAIGKPVPEIEMGVIDADGRVVPAGELGDIAIKVKPVRPPSLFREYWKDPEATAARHRGDWYVTGDLGRAGQDGALFLAGRADDVINCGGENIGPYELESILLEHAAVREAAVIGTPNAHLGEVPKAFVVTRPGFEPTERLADELLRYANDAVHPFKRLRELEFRDSLPTTGAGKISRRDLRRASHTGHR